jgi:hypothetical protein
VELNYAPVFPQTECLTASDTDKNPIFNLSVKTANGYVKLIDKVLADNNLTYAQWKQLTDAKKMELFRPYNYEVVVDYNALNYWFGDYFNIGVVQDPISEYAKRISVNGTVNRMELLRNIEEETGNVFVTRYEKDTLSNTIHRYLDFLNPININSNWTYTLEYDFYDVTTTAECFDEDGNIVPDDLDWEVTRFENDEYPPESVDEDTDTEHEDDTDVEVTEPYDAESNEAYDYETGKDYTPINNIDPSRCDFRITDGENLLNTDGEKWTTGDTALRWNCEDVDFDDTNYPSYTITLQKYNTILGVTINEKSYCVVGIGETAPCYIPELRDEGYISIAQDAERQYTHIPDNSYFEVYDHESNKTLFRTMLNTEIGKVHEDILDFGFNLENIVFDVDEADTYTAVSPVINISNENGDGKALTRSDIDTIINRWLNLSVQKGTVIPMIVEKVNITGTDASPCTQRKGTPASPNRSAEQILGTYNVSSNYWKQALKPTDQTENTNKTYEYYRGTAYWRAPYTKNAGEMHIQTDKSLSTEYTDIYTRPDTRSDKTGVNTAKMGNTETSDEDIYSIYNQVALYLKDHEEPTVKLDLDVANLHGHEYNNYELHDKIYVKLNNTQELISARITKTTKEAHDIAKNSIEINNYRNINTIKTITHDTVINCGNVSFKYPKSKTLTARLENTNPTTDTDQYPAGKLLTFAVYKLENNTSTFTGEVYNKLTNSQGYAKVNLKLDPGDYHVEISYYGDEIYEESHLTITANVSGTLPVATTPAKTPTQSKTVNKVKTTKKKKVIKTYWTKCGVSPDKKKVVAIAKPSSSDANKYNYGKWYKTVFKNKCPECGKTGTLRFDGGKANACITSSTYGVNWKYGVPEHEITCIACDSDFCGVTGIEKSHRHSSRLKVLEKPKVVGTGGIKKKVKAFSQLVKGKLQYGTKTITVKSKKVQNTKTRKIRAKGISSKVKQQAKAIVGNKTGRAAIMAIVKWIDNTNHMRYAGYPNFQRSPATCLKRGSANCCDGTRLFFELCDAVGLCEYYDFYYIHVNGHIYGQVITKKTKKKRYVDCASDYYSCWGYICKNYRGKSVIGRTKYPKRPI